MRPTETFASGSTLVEEAHLCLHIYMPPLVLLPCLGAERKMKCAGEGSLVLQHWRTGDAGTGTSLDGGSIWHDGVRRSWDKTLRQADLETSRLLEHDAAPGTYYFSKLWAPRQMSSRQMKGYIEHWWRCFSWPLDVLHRSWEIQLTWFVMRKRNNIV